MKLNLDLRYFLRLRSLVFILLALLISGQVFSQISSQPASYRALTKYTGTPQDSIFVFCDNIGTGVGELKADSPDGTTGWTFTWTKWDETSTDFSIPVIVENGQSSIVTNLTDGRYQVLMSKSGEAEEIDQAWVLNNSNTKPVLNLNKLDCVGVHFSAEFTPIDLEYYDVGDMPNKRSVIPKLDEKTVKFEMLSVSEDPLSSSEKFFNPPFNQINKSFIDQEAFEDERAYTMLVIDQYGCEFKSDVINSVTYAVKAEFTYDPKDGEAPLDVTFTNTSVNATEYEWFLFQDFDRIVDEVTEDEDKLLTEGVLTDKDIDLFTYLHPGKYFVKLKVKSDKGPEVCTDEYYLEAEGEQIVVDPSLVDPANYFIPSKHGKWIIKTQSLKSFNAIIFNRWGRIIYEWKDQEDSWDGKVNGKMATPGTYFYVITAVGSEEEPKKYTKKGSFMLIRK